MVRHLDPRQLWRDLVAFTAGMGAILALAIAPTDATTGAVQPQPPHRHVRIAPARHRRIDWRRIGGRHLRPAGGGPGAPTPRVPARTMLEWTRVAICEEGGWIGYASPAFPDSLGITAANWYGNGGRSDLRPLAQILVAERLLRRVGLAGWVPDQGGCAAW